MKHKQQSTRPNTIDASRRGFLSGALGLGAAGVGLTALGSQTASQTASKGIEDNAESGDVGYHETDHIRHYYRSAW